MLALTREPTERRGEGAGTRPSCVEEEAGVKVMASRGTASPGGSSGRAARLLVAWAASYAKCDLWPSSQSCFPGLGWSQQPVSLLQRECALGNGGGDASSLP